MQVRVKRLDPTSAKEKRLRISHQGPFFFFKAGRSKGKTKGKRKEGLTGCVVGSKRRIPKRDVDLIFIS